MNLIRQVVAFCLCCTFICAEDIPLFFWKKSQNVDNFGDALSKVIVEKIVGHEVTIAGAKIRSRKMLAVGSILHFARNGDVVWGSGVNGKIASSEHKYSKLSVFAVRGPLTRNFLIKKGISCPKIYGDPAILLPDLFPELKPTGENPFIVIPNLNEIKEAKNLPNVVLPTENPMTVIEEILKAKFVISGSLHGIIVAEAFGIPARVLRLNNVESGFKYRDYYLGSGRKVYRPAFSVKEALKLGGEPPPKYNKKALIDAFPFQFFTGGESDKKVSSCRFSSL